jgi:hypothetical protein
VSLPNYGKNLSGKRFILEQFVGNFKCLIGSLEVTGNFSSSNREKSRQWSQKTKPNPHIHDPLIHWKERMR